MAKTAKLDLWGHETDIPTNVSRRAQKDILHLLSGNILVEREKLIPRLNDWSVGGDSRRNYHSS